MKNKAHKFDKLKRLNWPVCACCGLVVLKNAASAKAVRSPCPGKEEDG